MVLKYVRFFLLGIIIVIGCIIGIIYSLFRPTNPSNVIVPAKFIGIVGSFVMGIKISIEDRHNLDNLPPCVVISNHQSNLDILPFGSFLPSRTVTLGKKSIFSIPLFGQMYWLSGNILIDRVNKKSAWKTMDKVTNAITNNNTRVWIMPEGTRSKGRGVLPFKKGAFATAVKAQCPILPVCISSMDKHLDFSRWKTGTIKVKILPLVETRQYNDKTVNELKDHCWNLISKEVENLDNSYCIG